MKRGGGEAGCDGGSLIDAVLPNTKIKISIPLSWSYSASIIQTKGFGLIPDFAINQTISDGAVMEQVKKVIVRTIVLNRY